MTLHRSKHYPIVAIVGRANVGKSTLWNRLIDSRRALVSNVPHTTRDRNYALAVWRGEAISVVDTGGMDAEQGSEIGRGILHQARQAAKEADLVLFLVDGRTGVMPQDRDLARQIRDLNRHVLLVVNKIDNPRSLALASQKELWQLNFGEPIAVSASLGRGVGDLLDQVYTELAKRDRPPLPLDDEKGLRLVIMGRPNVGKSSIVNGILGEERVIVSPIPHTTREPQDTTFEWNGERITLVDTAGMRKRSHVEKGIEEEGIERNRQALMQANVAFLVFDATQDPTSQDRHLAGLFEDAGKGLILVANKWDLVEDKTTRTAAEYERLIRQLFPFLDWAPLVFVSAKERLRMDRLIELAANVRAEARRQITYNALQRFLKTVVARKRPLAEAGPKSPYIQDVTQVGVEPPSFLVVVRGERENIHVSWLRYFENRLREKFGFQGTPIEIKARNLPMSKTPQDEKAVEASKRKTRRKRPMGRRVGRY